MDQRTATGQTGWSWFGRVLRRKSGDVGPKTLDVRREEQEGREVKKKRTRKNDGEEPEKQNDDRNLQKKKKIWSQTDSDSL